MSEPRTVNNNRIPRRERIKRGPGPKRSGSKPRKVGLSTGVYRKHPKGTRKRVIEDLDVTCSLIVRHRDGWRCVICGSTSEPQAGHLWKRSIHATRWELDAIWCSCSPCNIRHNVNPDPMFFAVTEIIGGERFGQIRDLRYPGKRFDTAELIDLLEVRRKQLREMPKTERIAA